MNYNLSSSQTYYRHLSHLSYTKHVSFPGITNFLRHFKNNVKHFKIMLNKWINKFLMYVDARHDCTYICYIDSILYIFIDLSEFRWSFSHSCLSFTFLHLPQNVSKNATIRPTHWLRHRLLTTHRTQNKMVWNVLVVWSSVPDGKAWGLSTILGCTSPTEPCGISSPSQRTPLTLRMWWS